MYTLCHGEMADWMHEELIFRVWSSLTASATVPGPLSGIFRLQGFYIAPWIAHRRRHGRGLSAHEADLGGYANSSVRFPGGVSRSLLSARVWGKFALQLMSETIGSSAAASMVRFHAASTEGDGGLSKLNVGGKPKCRAKKADGGSTNWDPKGVLTKPKAKMPLS